MYLVIHLSLATCSMLSLSLLGFVLKLITKISCSTDKMSEAAILEVARKNFGDHLILGEEGGLIGDSSSDYLWCIDPLGLVLSTF